MTRSHRKAMSGVVVAMVIIGFISVGISLDAMINTVNNAFGTGFSPTAGTQANEFESTLDSVCESDIDSTESLRMSTAEDQQFQIEFTTEDEINGETTYIEYQHPGNDEGEHENLYDDRIDCGVVVDDSQEVLNPGVTYTVSKPDSELLVVQ